MRKLQQWQRQAVLDRIKRVLELVEWGEDTLERERAIVALEFRTARSLEDQELNLELDKLEADL